MNQLVFRPELRTLRQDIFAVGKTSTGSSFVPLRFRDRTFRVYDNANLSVYSAQTCNAKCPFCVEELRPLSRGRELSQQKRVQQDDELYFSALSRTLAAVEPVRPSVSITGGEPSLDPRLPRILEVLRAADARKLTMTTNASGLLLDSGDGTGADLLTHVLAAELKHLNISRAHTDEATNQRIMAIQPLHTNDELRSIIDRTAETETRVRLSCVLLKGHSETLADCMSYLEWAASIGVDNVVFRQLMQVDESTVVDNYVTRYSRRARAPMHPILEAIRPGAAGASCHPRFEFIRQVLGYYYYVEVYRYHSARGPIDVCIEGADLARIEADKQNPENSDVVHELVFHPNGALSSTWQPWDGVLLEAPEQRQTP
ncbi:MAG: molybdenum cofactor biosynthesis enzyme MoaA [Bradymonadia bacterium]